MTARFTALQEIQLNLIEKDSTQLEDHINYWNAVRKENVVSYYARKEGFNRLGLQPLPVLAVSQYKAKEAIEIELLLRSLQKSQYASEQWTLADVSAELLHTPPKNCFKKSAFIVTVLFDNQQSKAFPYTCWDYIYYQDENSTWHKVQGLVDANGLYYKEVTGDSVYFQLFSTDAQNYGETNQWTVKFKNQTVFTSFASSSRPVSGPSEQAGKPTAHASPSKKSPRKRPRETIEDTERHSPTSTSPGFRLRRGRRQQQGDSTTPRATTPERRRRRRSGTGVWSAPSAAEVGSRSESVPRQGLGRLGRLQAEAWDPFIIILKGPSNSLKCWRYRCGQKNSDLYMLASTVFHWVGDDSDNHARLLLAFSTSAQRQRFLELVHLPKGTTYDLGNLNSL